MFSLGLLHRTRRFSCFDGRFTASLTVAQEVKQLHNSKFLYQFDFFVQITKAAKDDNGYFFRICRRGVASNLFEGL